MPEEETRLKEPKIRSGDDSTIKPPQGLPVPMGEPSGDHDLVPPSPKPPYEPTPPDLY